MIVRAYMSRSTLVLLAIMAVPCRVSAQTDAARIAVPTTDNADTSTRLEPERHPLYPVGVGAPDAMATRLCDALHTLPQARRAQCCGTPASSSLAGECVRTLTGALRAGAVKVIEAEIDQCVATTTEQLRGCDWVTPLTPPAPPACRNLVHGELQAGALCRSALECKDGLFCQGVSPTTPGRCTAPLTVGAACGQGLDTLALYTRQSGCATRHPDCDGICQAGQCVARVALGGACTASAQCAAGTHCAAGRCVDRGFAGVGDACSGDACAAGATCVGGRCVALKAAGASCTSPFECQSACVKRPGETTGTCSMQCDANSARNSSAFARHANAH